MDVVEHKVYVRPSSDCSRYRFRRPVYAMDLQTALPETTLCLESGRSVPVRCSDLSHRDALAVHMSPELDKKYTFLSGSFFAYTSIANINTTGYNHFKSKGEMLMIWELIRVNVNWSLWFNLLLFLVGLLTAILWWMFYQITHPSYSYRRVRNGDPVEEDEEEPEFDIEADAVEMEEIRERQQERVERDEEVVLVEHPSLLPRGCFRLWLLIALLVWIFFACVLFIASEPHLF